MIENNFKTIKMRVETFPDEEGITTLSFDIGKECNAVKMIPDYKNFFTPTIDYGHAYKQRTRKDGPEKFSEFEGIKEINHRVFYELVENYSKNHVVGYYVHRELVRTSIRFLLLGPYGEPLFSKNDKAALIEEKLIVENLENTLYTDIDSWRRYSSYRQSCRYLAILDENFNKDFYMPLIREKVWREDFFNHLFIYEDKEIKRNYSDEETAKEYIKAEKILSINMCDQYHFGRIKFVESAIDKDECVKLVQELFSKYGVTVELFAEDSEEMLIYSRRRNFYEKKIYPIGKKVAYFLIIIGAFYFFSHEEEISGKVGEFFSSIFSFIISLF